MANIGKLALILSADSTQLHSDFQRGMREATQFKNHIEKALNFASSIPGLSVIGGGILGAFSFDKIKESLAGIIELNKEALKLGFTIQQFSALSNTAGFEAEKFSQAMKHLGEAMQDAVVDPQGAMGKKFGLLGLDAEKMLGAGQMGALMQFADKIKAMSPTERLFATNIMGKAGDDLIPLLARGGGGIKAAMEHAERQGLVRSPTDALTAQQASAVISATTRQTKSFTDTAVVGLAGTFNIAKNMLSTWWHGPWPAGPNLFTHPNAAVPKVLQDITAQKVGGDALGIARAMKEEKFGEEMAKAHAEFSVDALTKKKAFQEKIAASAMGMLNAPPPGMPQAAMFGSQEHIDLMARNIKWGGEGPGDLKRIAEAAEKIVTEGDKQHQELMKVIGELGVVQGAF